MNIMNHFMEQIPTTKSLIFKILLLLCSLSLTSNLIAQQKGSSFQFEQFDAYQKELPVEKLYIQTNREVLSLGDTVWMSIYSVAGPYHATSKISGLAYVELISPEKTVLSKLHVRLDTMGVGAGQFALPDTLQAGNYHIRAYTNYMRNFPEAFFFTKTLTIQPRLSRQQVVTEPTETSSKVAITFFPEGGDLISGLPNKVAFKCTDDQLRPLEVSGVIFDENMTEIASFKTTHDGMGLFFFTPESGKEYQAAFRYNDIQYREVLPKAKPEGYVLSIRQSRDFVYLTIAASANKDFENALLLAHGRGKFFFEAKPANNGKLISLKFQKDSIPSGILHFTFFDGQGMPVCERLAYNDIMPVELPLEVTHAKIAGKRQAMQMEIAMPEEIVASMSMSVVPANIYGEVQANIREYMMLTSDLKGFINNPMHYFDEKNSNRIRDLDLLMMTHGWRRFNWEKVLSDESGMIGYFPESGFSVTGKVTGYVARKKGRKTPLQLSFVENVLVSAEMETDESGEFLFIDLPVEDTMTVVVRAMNGKKGEVDKNTLVTINDSNDIAEINFLPPVISIDPLLAEAAKEKGKELFDIKAAFDKDVVILDEFSLIAQRDRFDDPFHRPYQLYSEPSGRLVLDSIPGIMAFNNIFDIMRGRMAGVQVTGTYPNQSVIVRGSGSIRDNNVQFFFNGVPVGNDFINTLNVRDISHVDVLTGADAMAYPLAANGVILIYTKDGHSTALNKAQEGIAFHKIVGFHAPREFYMPDYRSPTDEEKLRPDFRSTLYWNPAIRPENGKANVELFTSDETGEFVYILEGLTDKGGIIRKSGTFVVQ